MSFEIQVVDSGSATLPSGSFAVAHADFAQPTGTAVYVPCHRIFPQEFLQLVKILLETEGGYPLGECLCLNEVEEQAPRPPRATLLQSSIVPQDNQVRVGSDRMHVRSLERANRSVRTQPDRCNPRDWEYVDDQARRNHRLGRSYG